MHPWSVVRRALPYAVVTAVAATTLAVAPAEQHPAENVVDAAPEPAVLKEQRVPTVPEEDRYAIEPSEVAHDHAEGDDHEHGDEDALLVAELPRRDTDPFSLVGVTWAKGEGDYDVQVSVRKNGDWSAFEGLHVEGGDSGEGGRPGTEPLWTGDADGVAVRVASTSGDVPQDLQVSTVDPGKGGVDTTPAAASVGQPTIISRSSWGASAGTSCDSSNAPGPTLGAVIHHTAGSNSYTKAQSAGIVKSTQAYHTKSRKWCDIGYNFLIDKYGQIFEGRKGGIAKQVRAAHSGNGPVNERTVGISLMGTFESTNPTDAMKKATADLVAWRLSLVNQPAKGTYSLGGKKLNRIAGHRDVVSTACPGARVYSWLSAKGGLRDVVETKLKNGGAPGQTSPTGLQVSAPEGGTSLAFTWNAIDDARRYHVKVSTSASMSSPTYGKFTENKGTITGLKPATTYYAAVALVDPDTNTLLSPYSKPLATATGSLPTITGLTSTGATSSSLSFGWTAIDGVSRYHVKVSKSPKLSSPVYGKFDTNKGTVTGLAANTTYYYAVVAVDPARNARLNDYSSTQSSKTPSSGSTSASGLQATSISSTSMTFGWTAIAGAKRYHVRISTSPSFTNPRYGKFTTNKGTISGLAPGTKYYFSVVRVDPATMKRVGSYSAAESASTKSASTTAANRKTVSSSGSVVFQGHGYGHGIGMSQYGAQGQARDGRKWTQILSTYYPGTDRSTKSGNIRVHITADTTDSVTIEAKSGVTFRQGKSTLKLPTSVGGKKVVRWSIDPVAGDKKKSALRYRTGSTWQVFEKQTWTGEAQFEASTLELVMPSGPNRVYRTALRSALPKAGATYRDTVNVLSIENYTRGVVAREMPASWHTEALKAQSVAARTYGVRGMNSKRYYDMCDTTSCQVYGGVAAETKATDAAVSATKGTVLTYKGALALTQFSSSSGGFTNVGSQPYLKAVKDDWDGWSGNANHAWKKSVSASTIQKKYPTIGTLKSLEVTKRNGHGSLGGRVSSLKIVGTKGTKTISGVDARWAFGLKSDWFGF